MVTLNYFLVFFLHICKDNGGSSSTTTSLDFDVKCNYADTFAKDKFVLNEKPLSSE